MENNSPEISKNQEYKSEIRLTPQMVQKVYNNSLMETGSNGKRKYHHDLISEDVFSEEKLEKNRTVIEKLADQLQPRFFNKETSGADSKYAVNDKFQTCWDSTGKNYKKLLSLISAIGLGKVTTTKEYLSRARTKDKDTYYYLVDKEFYKADQEHKKNLAGL